MGRTETQNTQSGRVSGRSEIWTALFGALLARLTSAFRGRRQSERYRLNSAAWVAGPSRICFSAGRFEPNRYLTEKTPVTMMQSDVPQGRNGKHKEIVTKILSDLDQIEAGVAVKVPLADLLESKEKVRSALNRATRKSGRAVATATDAKFLYVWNERP